MGLIYKYSAADLPQLEQELENIKKNIHTQQLALAKAEQINDEGMITWYLSSIKALDEALVKAQEEVQRARFAKDSTTLLHKLNEISEKNNCLRVRFYDWLANKLEAWAAKIRDRAYRITTPCAVKLPTKKEPVSERHLGYNGSLTPKKEMPLIPLGNFGEKK